VARIKWHRQIALAGGFEANGSVVWYGRQCLGMVCQLVW